MQPIVLLIYGTNFKILLVLLHTMAALCKLDYPIYACGVLDENHIVVAGGGGASKTGVPNAVDILKIEKVKRNILADPSKRLETGDIAPMNICVSNQGDGKPSTLAVGLGGICKVYSIVKKTSNNVGNNQHSGLKQRKVKGKKDVKSNQRDDDGQQSEDFDFKLLKSLETDTGPDPLQKSVRIYKNLIVTGGSDGFVRCWNLLNFTLNFKSKGHKNDVTDVDVSPDGLHIVSVSRDGTAVIWNAKNGDKETELHSMWNMKMVTRSYRFRCCRYGKVIENAKAYVLFTAHSPVTAARRNDAKGAQGCLTKWARKNDEKKELSKFLSPTVVQFTGREAISSMSLSDDGVFLGVGFMEGSVAIYISFSLQCAKRISNHHGIFVTGMTFLRNSEATQAITGKCDAALVSASADNTCKITKLSTRSTFPVWVAIFASFIALVLTGFMMQYFGIL